MIIAETKGNILTSNIQTLVVGVNTVGVMGKGLAFDFKVQYPDLFPAYKKACDCGVFKHKGIFVYTHSEKRKILVRV